jgi:hypothetical protein
MSSEVKWYCQNINCGAEIPKMDPTITAAPASLGLCPKCGGSWIGTQKPKLGNTVPW